MRAIILMLFMTLNTMAQTQLNGIAINVSLPIGWQIQEEDYGQVSINHPNEQAAIILKEHGWATEQVILENMQQNIQEENFEVALASDIMQLDNGDYIALYQGYLDQQAVALVAVVSHSSLWRAGGVMTVVVAMQNNFKDSYQDLAVELSKSIRYRPFMSRLAQQKAQMFKGRKLIRFNSQYTSDYNNTISIGSNSKKTIDFCSNGQYSFNGYSDLSAGGGAFDGEVSTSNSSGAGLWSLMIIHDVMVLRLVSNTGDVTYMPIESYTDDGAFYINGDKWVMDGSDTCN